MEVINAMREDTSIACLLRGAAGTVQRHASTLAKRTIIDDNEREFTVATEYRLQPDDEYVVHRSAHVTLKKPAVFAEGATGSFV